MFKNIKAHDQVIIREPLEGLNSYKYTTVTVRSTTRTQFRVNGMCNFMKANGRGVKSDAQALPMPVEVPRV